MTETALSRLAATIARTPEAAALTVLDPDGRETILTYGGLHQRAERTRLRLARVGLKAGDRLLLGLPTSVEFFTVYLACLRAGIIPAVMPAPRPAGDGFEADRIADAAGRLDARAMVTMVPPASPAPEGVLCVAARDLMESDPGFRDDPADNRETPAAEAVAHLQGTSGTTGRPRWAIVRHRNIAANVRAIGSVIGARADDRLVTWLPMSHDMGLIGLSYAWYWGIPVIAADPSNFVRNPLSWLDLIDRHRGTLSPAPNSAYQACCRVARLRPPVALDLSSWRVALCGAEPVHLATLDAFADLFGRHGLRPEALMPVYGLAEATLAVTLSSPAERYQADWVRGDSLAPGAQVRQQGTAAPSGREGALPLVACGRVLPGHELRVVDGDGRLLPDGTVGAIEVRGASVIDGYWGDDGKGTEGDSLIRDGFLRTGDLGYVRAGEIHVTGRQKEILIINGRNFSPLQIEAAIERAVGATFTPAVVAVGLPDAEMASHSLHLLLDGRLGGGGRDRMEALVRQTVDRAFGLRGVRLHWIAGGLIPKTTSGKIRRFQCRDLAVEGMARRQDRSLRPPGGIVAPASPSAGADRSE